MGIQNFSRLLKHYCPDAISHYPVSALKGKKIGIDLLGMGYTIWSIAHRQIVNKIDVLSQNPEEEVIRVLFFRFFKDYINKLIENEITPIFIIDSNEDRSKEKNKYTRTKRKKDKESRKDKVKNLQDKISKLDHFEVTSKQIKDLRQAHLNNSIFSRDSVDLLIKLIKILGIPLLTAQGMTGEADKLCAFLCKKGYIQGVITSDRDVLIFGCPYIITKFINKKYNKYTKKVEPHMEIVSLRKILKGTDTTYSQLVDVCILAGCDYNEKLYGVGITNLCELVKKYKKIENLPPKHKTERTNYEVCRKYFTQEESYEQLCVKPDLKLNIDFSVIGDRDKLKEGLAKFGLEDWVGNIYIYYTILGAYRVIPIQTKSGIINLKIRTNQKKSTSITSEEEWIKSNSNVKSDLTDFKEYM